MPVTLVPKAAGQVARKYGNDAVDDGGGHACKPGGRRSSIGIEHPLGVRPERSEHPIRCVARNRHVGNPYVAAKPFRDPFRRRENAEIQRGDFREVLGHQPHRSADGRIVREDHDGPARDTAKLPDAVLALFIPMVHGQYGHCRIHRPVSKGNAACRRPDRGGKSGRALRCHYVARLDGDHVPVVGLVSTGAGADVDNGSSIAQRRMDPSPDTRILAPGARIAVPDRVVTGHGHARRSRVCERVAVEDTVVEPVAEGAAIPNANDVLWGGRVSRRGPPLWRGVEDENGRLMVLIAYNNDVQDAWQWADDPRYPSDLVNLALRLGVNIAMYAMTH